MKKLSQVVVIFISCLLLAMAISFMFPGMGNRQSLQLAQDGLPTGQNTPEGVACDLARAFINADAELFKRIVVPPYGGDEPKAKLSAFVSHIVTEMSKQTELPEAKRSGPESIAVCYAARRLSQNGPASYAYAAFNFHDLMFVDVQTRLRGGGIYLNRTLVLKDKNGTWYVHPTPGISPLLMGGLNNEPKSEMTFEEKYNIRK